MLGISGLQCVGNGRSAMRSYHMDCFTPKSLEIFHLLGSLWFRKFLESTRLRFGSRLYFTFVDLLVKSWDLLTNYIFSSSSTKMPECMGGFCALARCQLMLEH